MTALALASDADAAVHRVADVRYEKALYPRLKPSDEVIARYMDAVEMLPPIVLARDGIIVDGYHRWQAHLRAGIETIRVEHLGDLTDAEILRESYRRNATHGHQLSTADKKRAADHLYRSLPGTDAERIADIAETLGLAESSAKKYVAGARQDEKKAQQDRAWDLWLDCWTQQAIADELGTTQPTVNGWLSKREQDSSFDNPPSSRQHFDLWSFPTDKDRDTDYFGRMPEQVVENLLWLYTEPGDIVADLFAGSGTTIDVAKRMGRRVWASDRESFKKYPTMPIREADATKGWPADAPKRVALLILDPPYWRQAAGRYSDHGDDLGNQSLERFMESWGLVVAAARDHAARIAFIVSPAQDGPMSSGRVVDLAIPMTAAAIDCGFQVERRVIVPYSTQQATGQQVEAAREHRQLLKLYRDLVVMHP